MKSFFLTRWFRDISIARKLYFTVGIMALLIGVELFMLFFSLNTLSAVRAYVGGEGLWSKAQKDAIHYLYKYGSTHNENDYRRFRQFMKVPQGDSKTRRELEKPEPSMRIAREGLIEGRNHPEDVDGMIKLFRRFNNVSYINRAITVWTKAELEALQILPIGEELRAEIRKPQPSQEKINALLEKVDPINARLTVLEDEFSYTLGEGSRWMEGVVMKLLFIIALTVEITGLLLAISVSRSMQQGLREIISAARAFAKGNLKTRARVFSRDEIGEVAQSFNQMSGELEKTIAVLEQAQKKFRALLESAPDAMVIVDKQGRIKLVNSQAEKLFEYRRDDMLEHSIDLLVPSRAGERTSTLTPNTGSTVLSMNLQGRKQNGKEFPVEISLSPLETEEGTLISAAIRDISERKHIKELENKNRELEQFAYIASHDLQEPLNTISSFIMLLEDEFKGKLDKDAGQYVNYIGEASDRMRMLITGLLEYSRIGKKCQLAAVDCNQLLSEVLSDMKSSMHESEASVIAEPLPNITAYPVEIRLLLQNLLSNAVKYRKPNVAPIIRISASHDESNWLFTVEDNGIGIDPKYAGKLFVIFQRLHSSSEYPGTGIGLAHCKKIVELHNGRIWFDSEPGAGSRFRFTIPRMLQAL